MKLLSWNVNGLRAVLGKGFEAFLATEDPDVLCLQEVKARLDQLEAPWLAGWNVAWFPAQKPGYSGTLTLSKRPIRAFRLGIGEPIGDAEGRVVTVELDDLAIVNVYTPNSQNELRRLAYRQHTWDPAFRSYCADLAARMPMLFCGDLNVAHQEIDLARPAGNRRNAGFTDEERESFSRLLDAGFTDTFRAAHPGEPDHYSWWSFRGGARERNVGWRIDYVGACPQAQAKVDNAFILNQVMGSDHCPVGVEIAM